MARSRTGKGSRFARALLAWYDKARRPLPWRESNDFYRVWLSEIMLQQTRVETVIPYYERFLARFPDIDSLARASEEDVLATWSGLGYYRRARSLHRAARLVTASRQPRGYKDLRELPGIGNYTAAAIASIAMGEPYAAVDGNVTRVVSRLTAGAPGIERTAQTLLDPKRPGDFNQAMMELGATICVPLNPDCAACPVAPHCLAYASGRAREFPIRAKKPAPARVPVDLMLFERGGGIYLVKRAAGERRMAGFWELPEKRLFPGLRGRAHGEFTHSIVNSRFEVKVWKAAPPPVLPEGAWFERERLGAIPLTTMARKAVTLQ